MINSIRIRNFKNIRSADIELERLTVFVGANASGKTSVLEAIHYCTLGAQGDPKKVFGYERHCDWLYTRGGSGDLSMRCTTDDGIYGVSASLPTIPNFSDEKPEQIGKRAWNFSKTPPDDVRRREALQDSRSMVFLHLNASQLAKESYSEDQPPRVEFDGAGLPSVLAYLKLADDDAFEKIQDSMRKFVPHFRRIRIQKKTIRRTETEVIRIDEQSVPRRTNRNYQGEALIFDFVNSQNIAAHGVSEGTLLLLGLMTVLQGPVHPNVLLMDDIEHGLHPLAQKQLLEVLSLLMKEYPKLQVLASAHSPYLLDGLSPEQVRFVAADEHGYSMVHKLVDHPQFEKWKDEMAPGEMWSLFGDKWTTGQGIGL